MGMRIEKVKIIDIAVSKQVLASMAVSIANAPAICPGCGAPFNNQGLKGSEQLKCEYCGFSIKR